MTWEEAVIALRNDPSKSLLVDDAYLSADLSANIERFRGSNEFKETLNIIKNNTSPQKNNLRILDIGAGNGIASISFALNGFEVTSIEPDTSSQVGSGAIRLLAQKYAISNLTIKESYMEDLDLDEGQFDIVYGRQVMHHAYDLNRFAQNCYRFLKPKGILLTVRDHVILNKKDKDTFLKNHPLHYLYGGENAFMLSQYQNALSQSGFTIKEIWSASQSPLNLGPWDDNRIQLYTSKYLGAFISSLIPLSLAKYLLYSHLERVPGRLYSILSIK